jgi:hypothetical protein
MSDKNSSYVEKYTGPACNWSQSSDADRAVCSEYGGNAPKGGVRQVRPTGNTTTDPEIRAMREGAKIRRGMSVEGNEERARGMQNRT